MKPPNNSHQLQLYRDSHRSNFAPFVVQGENCKHIIVAVKRNLITNVGRVLAVDG